MKNLLRFFVSGIFFFFPASSFSAGFDDLTTPDINEGKWSFAFNHQRSYAQARNSCQMHRIKKAQPDVAKKIIDFEKFKIEENIIDEV